MAEPPSEPERKAAALPAPGGSPQPASATANSQPQPAPPKPQSQKKPKADARRRKNTNLQNDGAVSDSVVPPMANQHPNKGQKQRQQSAALPAQHAQAAKKNLQKQRPVSVGGNMLPATPSKEQAYAGPTFQASPAASALPMPKFFSKSVPNAAKHSGSLDARIAGQKTPEQESSPEPDVVSPQPPSRNAQQSPLDLFFNAQKAENQRKASMQSPEMKTRQAPPATEPRNPFQQTGKSIFLRELDGDSDAMPSPKTVPPDNHDRDAYNQNLKDLLFNTNNAQLHPNATTPPQGQRSTSHFQSPEQQFYTPPPTQRSASGPSTPTPSAEQQNLYSLHYGNRNLSPLFKAARGDTPPARPSNLRQHSSASDHARTNGQTPTPPPQIDPNSFSRSYLDQHIRASQSGTMPHLPGTNGYAHQQQQQPYYSAPAPQYPPTQHVQQDFSTSSSSTTTAPSPRASTNGARDIRSMEDDLRRMLKVNVLGN